MSEAHQDHPPVPRLVVRVGVTGHRKGPDLASAELRVVVHEILLDIKTIAENFLKSNNRIYAGDKPVLRVISPLAEGADRLVAEEAIGLGYDLQVPLPFPQAEYELDFQHEDREGTVPQFRKLLGNATAVFELDGSRESEDSRKEAYEAVGHLVLRQCDVLIAIWDGKPARGVGGTAEIVESARSIEIPTIRIDPATPHEIELRSPGVPSGAIDALEGLLDRLLLPPSKEEDALHRFLRKERLGRRDEALELPEHELRHTQDSIFRAAFTWADSLANRYARAYRRSYKAVYLLGALAVLLAYLGSIQDAGSWSRKAYLVAELTVIGSIGAVTLLGRRNHWHERWLDDRHLAESLRTMRLLAPIGRVSSLFQVPAHVEKGNPRKTWFYWYFRALVRDAGLASARIDPGYLKSFRDLLRQKNIEMQIKYHTTKAGSYEGLHKWAHLAVHSAFVIAALSCVLHFVIHHHLLELPLNLAVIVLPAFGGAVGAILHQSEIERLAQRSHALEERLQKLAGELETLGETPSLQELARVAETFSNISLAELSDWRFLLLDRPLTLPA